MDWISTGCVKSGVATLDCLPVLLKNFIYAAFLFAGIITLFFLIYSGIRFMTSGGDAKQLEGARHTLTYAIIGFIVIVLSFTILNLISIVTGTTCITIFGFDNCQY